MFQRQQLSGGFALQANYDYCARLVREADRDRYLAALFAPTVCRHALLSLYAFNIEVTRVRDLARDPMPGEIRLQWWREIIAGERDGEAAAHPVAAAIKDTLQHYAISSEKLSALIDARSLDLYDQPMATLVDLDNYAARTQGAVFALAGEILGAGNASVKTLIRHAGIAYGVVDILNAVGRHALRRQLFLPLDVLARNNVNTQSLFAGEVTPSLNAALAEMRGHVRSHLAAAGALANEFSPSTLWPALLPVALVAPQLRFMDRRNYDPFHFVSLSLIKRQWLLWRAARDPRRFLFAG